MIEEEERDREYKQMHDHVGLTGQTKRNEVLREEKKMQNRRQQRVAYFKQIDCLEISEKKKRTNCYAIDCFVATNMKTLRIFPQQTTSNTRKVSSVHTRHKTHVKYSNNNFRPIGQQLELMSTRDMESKWAFRFNK